MELTKKKDRDFNIRMAAASPTTTVCDTTTATLPSSGISTQNIKDVSREDYYPKQEYFKPLQYSNEHQRNNHPSSFTVSNNTLKSRKHNDNVPSSHLDATAQSTSRNTNSYRRLDETQSPPRKRSSDKVQDTTSQKESKRNKTSAMYSKHDVNLSHGVDFYKNRMSNESHERFSDRFENGDIQSFTGEKDIALFDSDMMRGIGSKSIVPEEVRLRVNSRERQRMHDLNTALDSLRQVMPYSTGPTVKKLSKMSTLLLARNYIVMLTRSLEEMKRLVQELSTNARPKPLPTTPLLPDPAYIASILAANHGTIPATSLYLPPQTTPALHRMPTVHCLSSSTGAHNCACVECQRKSLLAASAFFESKKSS